MSSDTGDALPDPKESNKFRTGSGHERTREGPSRRRNYETQQLDTQHVLCVYHMHSWAWLACRVRPCAEYAIKTGSKGEDRDPNFSCTSQNGPERRQAGNTS